MDTRQRAATKKQKTLLQTLGFSGNVEELTLETASSEIERLIAAAKERVAAAKEWIKRNINLIDLAGRYTTLEKETPTEWAGPCPKCGGDDRFHVKAESFFCRHCFPLPGGDTIQFVQWKDGCTLDEACKRLAGGAALQGVIPPPITLKTLNQTKRRSVDVDKMAEIAQAARTALYGPEGEAGRAYLEGRGLYSETWETFGLGYTLAALPGTWDGETKTYSTPKQPAICMPWALSNGQVMAIRYRFLQAHTYIVCQKERTEKQTAQFGSNFGGHLFGGCALSGPGNVPALVICEGEINAMSIWQATAGVLDTLSLGSESQQLKPAAIRAILAYKRVIVWMDRPELVRDIVGVLPGAVGFKSPYGKDANDWLAEGNLPEILSQLNQ